MKVNKIKIILLAMIAGILFSCESKIGDWIILNTEQEIPPFVITKPVFEINERPGNFTYAGIVFNFLNTTDRIVNSVKVSFMIFGSDTQENLFNGNNSFEITMLGTITPYENKEVIISLDQYIYIAPQMPYIIDSFYISEILYTDETVWEDKYGIHRIR